MADLEHLCNAYALPKIADNTGPKPNQIIISLADKPSKFGQFDADVTQVFEAYRVESGACIWRCSDATTTSCVAFLIPRRV